MKKRQPPHVAPPPARRAAPVPADDLARVTAGDATASQKADSGIATSPTGT